MSDRETTIRHRPLPRWVPFALLTISTVALALPIIVLKRQRAKVLASSPSPPRRTSTIPSGHRTSLQPTAEPVHESLNTPPIPKDEIFNGAIYSAKAFGIATSLLTLGAFGGVWGVQSYLGVQNTEDFGTRVRAILQEKMPTLASRIHRLTEENEPVEQLGAGEDWDWEIAQKRLTDVFEKEGFYSWAETALKEVEAEGRQERIKRGFIVANRRDGEDSSGR